MNDEKKTKGAVISIISGSLLDSKDDVIVHQCNCTTNKAKGLSESIFTTFPYADVYTDRTEPDEPGTIKLTGSNAHRHVVAFFAQRYPGPPKYANDLSKARLVWFRDCLDELSELNYKSYGFPYNIGCGLAGGNWDNYFDLIKKWAEKLPVTTRINLYKI